MTVLNLTEGLGLIEAGIKTFIRISGEHQQVEESQKEKNISLSLLNLVLDFFKPSSGIRASPPLLLDIGDDEPDAPLSVQGPVFPS